MNTVIYSEYRKDHAENPCSICKAPPGVRCEHDEVALLERTNTKLHVAAERLARMLTDPNGHPRNLNQAEQRLLARAYLAKL